MAFELTGRGVMTSVAALFLGTMGNAADLSAQVRSVATKQAGTAKASMQVRQELKDLQAIERLRKRVTESVLRINLGVVVLDTAANKRYTRSRWSRRRLTPKQAKAFDTAFADAVDLLNRARLRVIVDQARLDELERTFRKKYQASPYPGRPETLGVPEDCERRIADHEWRIGELEMQVGK